MTTPDPDTWPALLHRLATNRTALVSLLLGLTAAVVVVTAALWLPGDVEVRFREFAVEHRVAPALLLTCVSA